MIYKRGTFTSTPFRIIQKHYECLSEPCNRLIISSIKNCCFLVSNKIVT
nr:MAG TPA: hypothetical protein [Caudoviricetes sp.]